MNYIQKKF